MSVEATKNIRGLLLKRYRAVLSTHSRRWPGFPFGSVILYCLGTEDRPLVLISWTAQYTHNLQADPCYSMLVGRCGAEDIWAVGRLTLLAEVWQLAKEEVTTAAEHYYHYFPESADYHRVHSFDPWVLQPVQWRFTGNFGAIHRLAAERVPLANPSTGGAERGVVKHMNKDRITAIAHYVELAGLPAHAAAQLAGIDTGDFYLRIGRGLHWLSFPAACGNPGAARQTLVQSAKVECWPIVEPKQS